MEDHPFGDIDINRITGDQNIVMIGTGDFQPFFGGWSRQGIEQPPPGSYGDNLIRGSVCDQGGDEDRRDTAGWLDVI